MSSENSRNTGRNLMIAGVGLTAALHGGIEVLSEHGHGLRIKAAEFIPWAPKDTEIFDGGTVQAGDPYIETVSGQTTDIGEPIQEVREDIQLTGASYARLFDADPMAGELEEQSVDYIISLIEGFESNGRTVTVSVQGLASAEDATNDGIAGVQIPSDDNQRLADFRRDTFVGALVAAGIDEEKIMLEDGIEGELTVSQLEMIQSMSDRFGYDSAEALIEAYNDDSDAIPPIAAVSLARLLDENRGVTAVVRAAIEMPGVNESVPTEEDVCFVPVLDIVREETTTGSWKVTVPYGVLVPVGGVLLASAAMTIAGGAGVVVKGIRASRARGAIAGGVGSGDANSGPILPPIPEEPVKPEVGEMQPVFEKPQDEPENKKRIWPWLLPPIVIVGAGLLLQTCDDTVTPKHTPRVAPADPCRGLDPVEKVVGTRTIKIRDGRSMPFVDKLEG